MGARKPDASEWEDEGSASSASSEESDGDSDVFEQPPPKKPKATPPAKGAKKTPARAPAKGAGAGADADAKPKGKAPAKKGQAKGARIETGNFCIELAKTGRANCRVCGSLIAHKSVRLGIEVEDKSWGTIMLWQHVECSRLPLELPFESVAGIDTLDADQVAAAKLTLYATGPPAHLVEVDPDEVLRSSSAVRTKEREPPATITTPLLPFQKIGLAWMCDQELGPVRGGILADEMGMGKTIQTLALIATHRAEQRLPADRAPPSSHPALVDQMGGAASGSASTTICMPCTAAGGTLVVCPVIALVQWQSELVKCTDGSLSVGIYHGNKRQQPAAELAKYDVVLTSYATIEYDYRQTVAQSKEPCEYCGKLLQPDKLEVHLRWYCGPAAQRSAAQSKTEKKLARPGAKGKGAKGKGATTTELKGKGATATKLKGKGATATKLKGKGATIMHLESDDDDDDDSPSASDDDDDGDDGSDRCLSCGGTASSAVNPLLLCDTAGCAGGLHLRCSALKAVPSGDWFCPTCTTRTAAGAKSAPEGKGAPGKGAQQPSKGPAATRIAGAASARGGKRGRAAPSRAGRDSSASDSDADSDFTNGEPSGAEGSSDEEDAHRAALGQAPASRAKRPVRAAGRRKPSGSGARSVLHEVLWQRLVLDEAHAIKDRRSQTAQAIYALRSSLRWALSGTPLQNRVGELYSLVQFLRLDPLSFYCCSAKGCECKSRDYRFTDGWRRCVLCGHSPLQHYSVFNKTILNPIKKFGYVGEGRKAMLALKQGVLDTALLRRTKEERAEDIALPPKLVTVRRDLLDEKELDFYNAIYTQSMAQFDTYVQRGVLLNNYAHIFDLLTRLRQAVDHPYLVTHSARAEQEQATGLSAAHLGGKAGQVVGDSVCGLCHELADDPVLSSCKHAFCRACAAEFVGTLAEGAQAQCPTCWRPLTIDLDAQAEADGGISFGAAAAVGGGGGSGLGSSISGRSRRGILSRLNLAKFQSSTKIEALMEELSMMESRDPVGKAIVFSQFVSMLDLIEWRLQRGGVRVVKLDGSMSVTARSAAIDAFMKDPSVKVILISLKAGGVALNLTVATHIFIMDPWWNGACEQQAIDRAHRIGQHKPVRAVRFIMRNTVEERIVILQDKKRLVFDGTVGGDIGSLQRLSEDDMRFLFQG